MTWRNVDQATTRERELVSAACVLRPASCVLRPSFTVSCRRKPLEPGSNACVISALSYQPAIRLPPKKCQHAVLNGAQTRCLHLDVLLSRTHTTQDVCSFCVKLREQVSRRNAPRARLRTGLDPSSPCHAVGASLKTE